MHLWTTPTKVPDTSLFVDEDGRTFPLGVTEIFVELVSSIQEPVDLMLVDADTDIVQDTLKFHMFETLVIGFSGETVRGIAPLLGAIGIPFIPAVQQPTFDIAWDLYNRGYDVQYYDVWDHSVSNVGPTQLFSPPRISGPAIVGAINAIANREVRNLAVWGWSHGGGATYQMSRTLNAQFGPPLPPYSMITAYIDAVKYEPLFVLPATANWLAEDRLPIGSAAHANWYQTNPDPFHGTSVPGSEIDDDLTAEASAITGMDHVNIAQIVAGIGNQSKLLMNFIEEKMPKR